MLGSLPTVAECAIRALLPNHGTDEPMKQPPSRLYKVLLLCVITLVAFLAVWHFLSSRLDAARTSGARPSPANSTARARAVTPADETDSSTRDLAVEVTALLMLLGVGALVLQGVRSLRVAREAVEQVRSLRERVAYLADTVADGLSSHIGELKRMNATARKIAPALRARGVTGEGAESGDKVTLWQWRTPAVKLVQVGGLAADVSAQVGEVINRCRGSESFARMNIPEPRGLLLCGPSGVGKTMLANAIACELGREICVVSGPALCDSPLYLTMILKEARERKPGAVVFIDEIDAVAQKRRGTRLTGLDTHLHLFLVLLMTELEALEGSNVLVIACTNRVDMLDPALLRAGRLEKQICLDLPTPSERLDILRKIHQKREHPYPLVHIQGDPPGLLGLMAYGVSASEGTGGFSGADLANALDEAAVVAAAQRAPAIDRAHVREGIRRVRQQMIRHAANEPDGTFGRTTATFQLGEKVHVRFEQVGGATKGKKVLRGMAELLKQYRKLTASGCRLPKGVLLSGPPGVGKTLLARAVAGESGAAFFSASAAEFEEMFVGIGAARVRDLFRLAARQEPCVIFIDEIDALGARRNDTLGSGEHSRTLNQLLTEMDGFEAKEGMIVLAATNRPGLLDDALTRAGRFDFKVELDYPTLDERREIVGIYRKGDDQLSEVKLNRLLDHPALKTGADIANLFNLARIRSVLRDAESAGRISDSDVDAALTELSVTSREPLSFPLLAANVAAGE